MKLTIHRIKRRFQYLKKLLASKVRILTLLWKIQKEKSITSLAQSLAYTSIVSLIPIAAIFFSILGLITKNDNLLKDIKGFLTENFLPQSVTQIFDKLEELSKASFAFGAIGIPTLIIAGVLLYIKVDFSINSIWETKSKRAWLKNLLAFLISMFFGPILLILAFSVPTYLKSLPYYGELISNPWVSTLYGHLIPISVAGIGLTILLMYIPAKRVKFRAAIAGGLTASSLLHISNGMVNYYLSNFSNYDVIFGSLAILPIFLLWIYVVWLVILIGAAVAYIVQSYTKLGNVLHFKNENDESLLSSAIRVLTYITYLFENKKPASDIDQLQILLKISKERLEVIIDLLKEKNYIIPFDDKRDAEHLATCFQPAYATEKIKLFDIIKLFHRNKYNDIFDSNVNYILSWFDIHPQIIKNKDITLADIIKNPIDVISKIEATKRIEISDIVETESVDKLLNLKKENGGNPSIA